MSPASAALRAAFVAAAPFVPRLEIVSGTDSRSLPIPAQRRLVAHRLLTHEHTTDFEVAAHEGQLWFQPNVAKGLSFFVVLSEDDAVTVAGHAVRCSITKAHFGCSRRILSDVPDSLTLIFDRVLDSTASPASSPIIWHATLTPKEEMLPEVFQGVLKSWQPALCAIRAAAECPPEIFVDPGALKIVSSFLEPYIASKLAHVADSQRLQPAGGSPGT